MSARDNLEKISNDIAAVQKQLDELAQAVMTAIDEAEEDEAEIQTERETNQKRRAELSERAEREFQDARQRERDAKTKEFQDEQEQWKKDQQNPAYWGIRQ